MRAMLEWPRYAPDGVVAALVLPNVRLKKMAKLVHAMIRVLDADRATAFYQGAFGLQIVEQIDFPDFALIYLNDPQTGGFELELTVNFGRTEPYALGGWLWASGGGYGHLAAVVDDVDAEHVRLSEAGLAPPQAGRFSQRRGAGWALLLCRRPRRLSDRNHPAGRALRLSLIPRPDCDVIPAKAAIRPEGRPLR